MPTPPKDYRLVLLVGPPGSGKSTYCQNFLKDYYRISQDDQGKKRHYELFLKAINDDVDKIVVDRMNFNKAQRAKYLSVIPEKYHVTIVVFNVQEEELLERIKNRKNHPTLQYEKAKEVINFFIKNYEAPDEPRVDSIIIEGHKDAPRLIREA